MHTKSLVLAAVFALAGAAASAQEATPWPEIDTFAAPQSRAEVKAEAKAKPQHSREGFVRVGLRERAAAPDETHAPKSRVTTPDPTAALMYVGG